MKINIEKYSYDENGNLIYLKNDKYEEWREYNEFNLETNTYRKPRDSYKRLVSMKCYNKLKLPCIFINLETNTDTVFSYYDDGILHETVIDNKTIIEDKYENGLLKCKVERYLKNKKIIGMDFYDYDEDNNLVYIHSTFDDTETKCTYYPNGVRRSYYTKFYEDEIPYSEYCTYYDDGRTKSYSLINLKDGVLIKDTNCIYYQNNNMRRVVTRYRDDKFRLKLFNTNGEPILILNSNNNTETKFLYNSKNQLVEKINISYDDDKQLSEIIFNLL